MTHLKWDVGAYPCPGCNQLTLVYDGSVKWRSGSRPPRRLATKGAFGFSPRADFEVAHYLHCGNCLMLFYDSSDGRLPRLTVEEAQLARSSDEPTGWPPGSIGDVSARIGYDVRDLKMAGYSDEEIYQVASGQRSLEELLGTDPRKRNHDNP